MPDIAWTHAYVKYIHIVGVFLFLLAHGVSAAVVLRLRRERDPVAIRTLLELSMRSMGVMTLGLAIWFFSGILLGFSGNYWTTGRYWLWASLAVVIVIFGVMTPLGRFYLDRVRKALGIDPKGPADQPISATVDAAALETAIMSGRPLALGIIGFGGVAVLAWLMMFKPF
jgi:hypothetical protein